ncbi:CD59 glycoprotein-like [Leptodactylus fuscus]|uniref:CD59 glycoprotein-like n=1 Tax=Leptodactylus fuscus TaxID=238119 RepID=UPI003F4E5778
MNRSGILCAVLAVGLAFLSLCSTGQALDCYNCDWSTSLCIKTRTCTGTEDACMWIKQLDGRVLQSCRQFSKCSLEAVKPEYNIQNVELACCQKNLCNSGVVAYPSIVLLLSLATALMMMMS